MIWSSLFFFFFKEIPDTWVGWRVPKKLRNPEQIFMAPLIKHTWGERLGFLCLFTFLHLSFALCAAAGASRHLPTGQPYSLVYNQSSLKQNKTYFLMLLSFLNDCHNRFRYFSYHLLLWLLLSVVTTCLLSFSPHLSFPDRYDFFPTLSQRWNESILNEWCLFTGLSLPECLFYWQVQWIEDITLLIRC